MAEPTTPLPPFAALRAFHAAALHGPLPRLPPSGLGVTESAISHQVRRLEDFLRIALFDRSGAGVRLTAAGRRYFDQIDPAIRQIQAATEALLRPSGRNVVRLTLPPSLAATWLIPRLGAFERDHPDLELQLVPTTRVLDLRRDQVDLAIRHGKGAWPGIEAVFLLEETALPVCARGYVGADEDPLAALQRARLIVNARFPDEWEEWARARGLVPPSLIGAIELEGIEQALPGRRGRARHRHGATSHGRRPPGPRHAGRTRSAPAIRPAPPTICAGHPTCRRPRSSGASSAGCAAWPARHEHRSSRRESKSLASRRRRHLLCGRWTPRPPAGRANGGGKP